MMALKGNLNTVDLANIFQMLSLNQCEGTLYIFEGASRKAIYFAKDGVSMLSKGRPRSDALGRILVRQDHVTPEQLDAALVKQAGGSRLLGQILVDDGACMREDVEAALEIQIREEVCRLFLWKDAQFEFVEGEPDEEFRKEGVQRLTFSVNGIIVEAARRVDEWEWIQRVVPEMSEVYGYTGTNVDLKDSVFSEAFAGKVLAAVDGRRSVDEVIDASCVNKFEVCKILAILVESGAAAKLTPDDLSKLADAATAEGDGAATAKFLSRLVAAKGETPEIHKRLGEAFQSMRELEKSAHHYGVFAEVRADAKDVKEAFEVYQRICGLLPTDLAAADRMIELFASAPDGLEAHAKEVVARGKQLAEIYMELKRPARAVQALQRIASLGPDDLDLRGRLVTVYLASGMNAEAIAEYEALADAALARKDYENAETICRRILAIDRNRADIAARIEQVVEKRRFRARGIQSLLLAAGVVTAASVATWQAVALYKGHKTALAQRENETQDALQSVRAKMSPLVAELDALLRELSSSSTDPMEIAEALRARTPRIEAAQRSVADAATPIAELSERCEGMPTEEDALSLAADVAGKSAALKRKTEDLRRIVLDAADLHFDQGQQMLVNVESTRAVLAELEIAVKLAEDCDGPLKSEKGLAWIELRSHVRGYVNKFDETKAAIERRIAERDVDAAHELAVAYLVDKDFPPPDLRAAMPLPVRLVSRPAGARVLTHEGVDTGLVAGPDCCATISLATGASFVFDAPGFERASLTIPAVKDVDVSVVRERVKNRYVITLDKTLAFRRATSEGKAVCAAPFASDRYLVVPSSKTCDVVDLKQGRLAATLSIQAELGLRSCGVVATVDGVDIVVLPTADGSLRFFDAETGKPRGAWSESHGAVTFDLALVGADVIAADDRGGLYCVGVARRTKRWGGQALLESGEPAYFSAAPVVAGGSVYVGCEDGTVRVVDLADGRVVALLARPAADAGRVCAQTTVDGGAAYVLTKSGAKSTRVTKWDVASAHAVWSTTVAGESKSGAAVVGGDVFVVTTGGDVIGLGAADGRPTRSTTVDRAVKVIAEATLDGSTLYVGCDDGVLYALDLGSKTIEPSWKFVARSPAGRPAAITTRCVAAGGLLLFGAADDAIYALERSK
jgi:outer membrane protein assembly factor BamB/tetratricopeptide (TPR) repeat protein